MVVLLAPKQGAKSFEEVRAATFLTVLMGKWMSFLQNETSRVKNMEKGKLKPVSFDLSESRVTSSSLSSVALCFTCAIVENFMNIFSVILFFNNFLMSSQGLLPKTLSSRCSGPTSSKIPSVGHGR